MLSLILPGREKKIVSVKNHFLTVNVIPAGSLAIVKDIYLPLYTFSRYLHVSWGFDIVLCASITDPL